MRKRLSSKVLAVILTLAICATTVLGCLMTVGAEVSCYKFGESKFDGDDLTQATIDVTFTAPASLPNGFVAGTFSFAEAEKDGEDYLIFEDVTSKDVIVSVEDNYVIFESEEAVKTAKFTFTVGFSTGEATEKTYQVALSEEQLVYNDIEYLDDDDITGDEGQITAACKHVIAVVGEPVSKNEANDYSVYENSVCTKCGETFGKQLVPGITTVDTDDEVDETITMDSTTATAPKKGTGIKDDPYVIESVNNLIYIVTAGPDATYNKYYKVADGIKNIVLQPSAIADDVMALSTLGEVETFFATSRTPWVDPGNGYVSGGGDEYSKAFCGHFDGNGATIYGLYRTGGNMSLFGTIGVNSSFKNFAIKNSYGTTGWYAGLIAIRSVGFTLKSGEVINKATTKMDRIELSNNKIECLTGVNPGTGSFQNGNQCVGLLFAQSDYTNGVSGFSLTNLLVYGNEIEYTHATNGGVYTHLYGLSKGVAVASETSDIYMTFENSVVLDCSPWGTGGVSLLSNWSNMENVFSDFDFTTAKNTYGYAADYHDYKQITKESVTGSAAFTALVAGTNTTISWGDVWLCGAQGEYPSLRNSNEVMSTIYWSGSAGDETINTLADDPSETGSVTNPIIIDSAEELHVLALSPESNWGASVSNTTGKYFKVADHIDTIILQSYINVSKAGGVDAIIGMSTTAEVEKLFTQTLTSPNNWITNTNESIFNGNFNGNGVKIYGLYASAAKNVGLFPCADGGTPDANGEDYVGNTFENFAIRNSYYNSTNRLGAVVGMTYGFGSAGKVNGHLNFKNIEISNNCMIATNGSQVSFGVVLGNSNAETYAINNCLVYGNNATYNSATSLALCGGATDRFVWVDGTQDKTQRIYACTVKNTVTLGTQPYNYSFSNSGSNKACFENVYTDADIETYEAANKANLGSGYATYYNGVLFPVTASNAMGAAANTYMPNLAWGTNWYCGAEGEYPVLAPFATLGASKYSSADLELIGHNTTYNNDGSVDFNFHFVPKTAGVTPVLYVGTLDGDKFVKVKATKSSLTGELGEEALMYTIPNLSARDINRVWLPTLVLENSAVKEWSKSEQLALADNARAIIAGDYSTADKNVAAALLNYQATSDSALNVKELDYNAGTIDLLEFGDYLVKAGSLYEYYDTKLADNGETGEEDDPIIIDSAEEFVFLCKGSEAHGINDTAGKFYKVADGIAGFNLTGNEKLDLDGTLEDNLSIVQGCGKNHSGNTPGFQGHFDGNGVTVYGAWTNDTWDSKNSQWNTATYAGLFSCTKGNVTIKNVNVRLSYFVGLYSAGGIVGYYKGDGIGSLTIENCSVTDTHIESWGVKDRKDTTKTPVGEYGMGIGAVAGYVHNYGNSTDGPVTINNCYANLDDAHFVSPFDPDKNTTSIRGVHGGMLGFVVTNYTNNNAGNITNCIAIGIKPYATQVYTAANDAQHSGVSTHFANIYTDQASGNAIALGGTMAKQNFTGRVTQLTKEQLTGYSADKNMPALDWNNVWTTTNGYPTFINKDYTAPAGGYAIYWDGANTKTAPTVGSGKEEDPYIISTVAELAYVIGQTKDKYTVTLGQYYKIADGITSIVMQPEEYAADIMALGSAAAAKSYFEANASKMKQWTHYGWEGSTFCGNIDFNGATVYGIYQVSGDNAGFISNADAGAVIRNLSIKNSYLVSTGKYKNDGVTWDDYQVGGIVSNTNGNTHGQKATGFIWFNNCIVANNYMYNNSASHDRSGVIIGASSDIIYIDNCLTYDNDATYGAGVVMPIWSCANNSTKVSSNPTVPKGLTVVTEGTGDPLYSNMVRNSMIFGNYPYDQGQAVGSRFNNKSCYENVYTDIAATKTFFSGISDNQIAVVSADKALGADANTNMPNLDWSIWHVGATGDMPGFKPAGSMPSSTQTLYNAVVLDTIDSYGDSVTGFGVYATGLTLKTNPYMTFTFEFAGEYKDNRDKINVKFTYEQNGETKELVVTPPACEYDENGKPKEIKNVNGWTNTTAAGRFHTYRATTLPVYALANGISVSVSYDGGEWVDFGTYSAEGFAMLADNANKTEPCEYYATRYEAAKALLFYVKMLEARYGA